MGTVRENYQGQWGDSPNGESAVHYHIDKLQPFSISILLVLEEEILNGIHERKQNAFAQR
jgi:hypothetical protein